MTSCHDKLDACSIVLDAICACTAEQRSNTMFVMGFLEATMVTLREIGERSGHVSTDERDYVKPHQPTYQAPFYDDELRHIVTSVLSQCPTVTLAPDDDCDKYNALKQQLVHPYASSPGPALWWLTPYDDPEVQRVNLLNQPVKTQMDELACAHRTTIHVDCILDHATYRKATRDENSTRCPMYFRSDIYHTGHISTNHDYIEGYKVALRMTYQSVEPRCRPILVRPLLTEGIHDDYTGNIVHYVDEPLKDLYQRIDVNRITLNLNDGTQLICHIQKDNTQHRLAFVTGNCDVLASMEADIEFVSDNYQLLFLRKGDQTHFANFDNWETCGCMYNKLCLQILLDIACQLQSDPASHFVATKHGVSLVNGVGDDVYSFTMVISTTNDGSFDYGARCRYVDAVITNRAGITQITHIQYVHTAHDKYGHICEEECQKFYQQRVAICEAICSPERKALMASIVTSSGADS